VGHRFEPGAESRRFCTCTTNETSSALPIAELPVVGRPLVSLSLSVDAFGGARKARVQSAGRRIDGTLVNRTFTRVVCVRLLMLSRRGCLQFVYLPRIGPEASAVAIGSACLRTIRQPSFSGRKTLVARS
jgi:hypothetical protein